MGLLARTDTAGTPKPAWLVARRALFNHGLDVPFLVQYSYASQASAFFG